jgi:cytochrome c oxidase assembly factor CtaG
LDWQPDPLILIPLLAVGVAYLVGYRRLRRRERAAAGVARRRAGYFAGGYLALVVALVSPLHALGEAVFSVHMAQHLLLTMVAAPLLLLSSSMPVLLWALPPRERHGAGRLLAPDQPLGRGLRLATRPVVAWCLYLACQWGWHQQAAYELALVNPLAHYAEHVTFFATAIFFWWPVIGTAPLGSDLSYPVRLLYTFLAWIPNSVLGAGITLAGGVLYPHYIEAGARFGVDAAADQVLAGLIMWVPGDVLFLVALLVLLAGYLRHEEREAERIDRELDAREGVVTP